MRTPSQRRKTPQSRRGQLLPGTLARAPRSPRVPRGACHGLTRTCLVHSAEGGLQTGTPAGGRVCAGGSGKDTQAAFRFCPGYAGD